VAANAIRILGLLLLLGCGEEGVPPAASPVVRGALIDGSEDPGREPGESTAVIDEPSVLADSGSSPITFRDLSLAGLDVDALLDAVLFPEEYEPEELEALALPERITRFDGRDVSIVGYMIPGELEGNEVRDFMLVRDLMSCCFGGSPNADEWIDVVMVEGELAVYHPFLPMRVEGRMSLGGAVDDAGFAVGIFHLEASRADLED